MLEICMMEILILSSTEAEISQVRTLLPGIDILVGGVGAVPTCYHLLEKIHQKKYGLIIQCGVAGSFTDDLETGEVVVVSRDAFGDLGLESQHIFVPLFNTGLANGDEFPFTKGWLDNPNLPNSFPHLKKVKAVTVNKVTDSLAQKEQLLNHFQPDIESMEGAAFHYVALQKNIRFLQLRAISNQVGEPDRSKWDLALAISNLAHQTKFLVDHNEFNT